jgi:hypothetical protein
MLPAVPDPATVLLDPAAAYPEVTEVRTALHRRDWPAVRALLDRLPPAARSLLIRFGSDEDDLEQFLRGVLAADPEDSAAGAMLGFHLVDVGWKVRTGARATNVSRAQFDTFHGWLRRAEQVLIDAAARHPADPAVWSARLISARGLDLGLAETRRRYDRLRALDPHPYQGQTQFLQTLCPKWSGSWEQLHAWSREEMLAAPLGSLQGALVAMAHIEHWSDLKGPEQQAYLELPHVREELREAGHRSIWHPHFRRSPGWVHAVSTLAMAFSLVRDEPAAGSAFVMLGELATDLPWAYLAGDTVTTIRKRRARALAAVQGAS